VRFNPAGDWGACVDNYYVLGHELLHYICAVYDPNCSPEANQNHSQPGYFMDWALSFPKDEVNQKLGQTAEYWIYVAEGNDCAQRYPDSVPDWW